MNEQPAESEQVTSTGLTAAEKRQVMMETFEKLMDIMFGEDSGSQPATTETPAAEGDRNGMNKGSIAGRVTDAAGNPAAGVTVTIDEGPPHIDIAAFTNAEGRFRLSGLAPGSYSLLAHRGGQAVGGARTDVAPGQQAEVEIRLNG
jgi:hypothetical protein